MAAWIATIDAPLLERRFGSDVLEAALASPRLYAQPPSIDAASRLVGVVVATAGGKLSTPLKVAVRIQQEDVIVSCACRHPRICEHVIWLLTDVAIHPGLRAALLAEETTATDALAAELPALRARALEERTLEQRIATWLPSRTFDEDFEMDVDVDTTSGRSAWSAGAGEDRAAVFLRHRRSRSRSLVPARDVLAMRLTPRHRRLVELAAPYHLDKNVLVATRGQASTLVHLLREEIGVHADHFKTKLRFARGFVRLRADREGDRLIARWYADDGAWIGDARETLLLAGPFPHLWCPASHTFHVIAADVDLDAAEGMMRVPSLPLSGSSAATVGRALLTRGGGLGIAIPRPEIFGLPPLERPTFELRLTGTPLDVVGELHAVYAAGKVPVGDERAVDGRDRTAEEAALALVARAGLTRGDRGLGASEDQAVGLWREGIAALRASTEPSFELLLAESLARTKLGSPVEVDVRVTTTAGWLDTELEFRAGALKVEMERMHRALAGDKRWIVLSDGSLAKIAEEVAVLVGQVTSSRGPDGRIPPHQFGRVARWIELADSASGAVRVTVDPEAATRGARLRELARHAEPALPVHLEATLRPYQRAGLAWLQLLRELGAGGLLADDMGLGKTLMTLAFLQRWREDEGTRGHASLVVCPTSVVGNWIREAKRFTPQLRVVAWTGSDRAQITLSDYDVVVTTYGLLRRDVERLARTRLRCVVLDEAQNIKNAAAETTRAARRLDAELRIALTGTPVENRLSELWSLMTFLNPGMLGTAADFDARYERPIALRPDGEVARDLRSIVRPFILRRTKGEVLTDLPPKTEVERTCVLGLRQKRLYDALALAARQAVAKTDKRADARTHLSVLTAILRLRQMACDPRLVTPDASPSDSAKRVAFLDLVRELVSEGRRALVFSQFVELLGLWREDLDRLKVAYEYLDGSSTNRDAIVDRFQQGNAPLFLISLKAGGAGLNLTAADTVIHCDPWWNPAAEDQATDRAHRIGQTRAVTVVRLVAQGTIEDKIALLKKQKHELASAILGEDARALTALAEEDVGALLGDADGEPDEDVDAGEAG